MERGEDIFFTVQFIADNTVDSELFSLDFSWRSSVTGLNMVASFIVMAVDSNGSLSYLYVKRDSTVNNQRELNSTIIV